MQKLVLSFLAAAFITSGSTAQTLFTYGSNSVSKEEFLRNYEKNTMNKKPDLSEPALREYLDLFSLYKMKVKEAEGQQLDTLPAIQRDLDNYRRQLSKNYLTDKQVNNRLLQEAYERMKEDRHVAHILIMAPASMSPEDTLVRYRRMDSIYTALTKNKADFSVLAKQYSEDKGSNDKGGDIGYMTSMQTLYPFENAAYTTEVGKVSRPFRTALGYHIVKVLDKRPSRGEVQVAQILFATPKSQGEDGIKTAKAEADKVYAELKRGASFTEMVKEHSDDKFTVKDEGVMPQFGVGRMVPAFEDASFSLKKPGDISAPIQTEYGFHIIKLINKYPVMPFDSVKTSLSRKIENDSRSQIAKDAFFEKIKEKNGFKEYPANYKELLSRVDAIPDTGKMSGVFDSKEFATMSKPVFTLGATAYTQKDLMDFASLLTRGRLMGNRHSTMNDIYKMYEEKVVNDYQEHKLIEENPEFRNLMGEYRDGIMLFELMDRNVWTRASKDTIGLQTFYNANKTKYQWEPGFSGTVYHFKDETAMKDGMKLLEKNKKLSDEDFVKTMNTESNPDAVTMQEGRYEFSRFSEVPKSAIAPETLSQPVKNTDASYTVVKTDKVFNGNSQKSLNDARGYVIAEYQDYLEKQWNANLKAKYPVKVDEKVFKSMVK